MCTRHLADRVRPPALYIHNTSYHASDAPPQSTNHFSPPSNRPFSASTGCHGNALPLVLVIHEFTAAGMPRPLFTIAIIIRCRIERSIIDIIPGYKARCASNSTRLTTLPGNNTRIQCWKNVGPASKTVGQHYSNIGSVSCVC